MRLARRGPVGHAARIVARRGRAGSGRHIADGVGARPVHRRAWRRGSGCRITGRRRRLERRRLRYRRLRYRRLGYRRLGYRRLGYRRLGYRRLGYRRSGAARGLMGFGRRRRGRVSDHRRPGYALAGVPRAAGRRADGGPGLVDSGGWRLSSRPGIPHCSAGGPAVARLGSPFAQLSAAIGQLGEAVGEHRPSFGGGRGGRPVALCVRLCSWGRRAGGLGLGRVVSRPAMGWRDCVRRRRPVLAQFVGQVVERPEPLPVRTGVRLVVGLAPCPRVDHRPSRPRADGRGGPGLRHHEPVVGGQRLVEGSVDFHACRN